MKFFLVSILLGFGLSMSTHAQMTLDSLYVRDTVHNAYQQKMDEIFDSVDFSHLSTGILFDRGFSFINLECFDGTLKDESKSSMLAFGLSYASIETMTVEDSVSLPDPSDYRNVLDTITSHSEVILIAGLHQQYDRIDSSAIADGLFSQSGDNLSDVFPRAESPYNLNRVFLFAPAENRVRHAQFKFRFDSGLFYDNYGVSIDSLRIDMGNGAGYERVYFDQDFDAMYSTGGRKNVKVELAYSDGAVFYSHFDVIVDEPGNRTEGAIADFAHYIPETGTSPTDQQGGHAFVYLACGHTSIEKPFIWAEAYNPNVGSIEANLTPQSIYNRINHVDGTVNEKRLWDHLLENGYDIIILDYDDGGDFLPRTAEFIKEVLRWVNTEKEASGSSEKNIILGQSMGGVCTMQALKEMENAGENHEVETFYIFDSPILGVNIPLMAQASVYDIAFMRVKKPFVGEKILMHYVEEIEDVVRILNIPATRTMVTYLDEGLKWYDIPVRELVDDVLDIDTDHLYPDHYDYLHNDMGGMPTQCEVLTMTNGSRKGTPGQHNYTAGDLVVHSEVNNFVLVSLIGGIANADEGDFDFVDSPTAYGNGAVLLWAGGFNTNLDIKMYAMENSTDFEYYSSDISVEMFWGAYPVITHEGSATISDQVAIDHVPGGFFGAGNRGVILSDSLGSLRPEVFEMTTWCFTPTGSVLNYESPTGQFWWDVPLRSYENNETDISANYVRGVDAFLSNSETRTWETESTYQNTAHTWFTNQNAYFFLYHLKGKDELLGVSSMGAGTTFNFGEALAPTYDIDEDDVATYLPFKTLPIIDHSITIDNTTMSVNANDLIGLTPSPYAPDDLGNATDNSHITVNIGPLCQPSPAVDVVIENNAELTIGDGINRTGSVHIQDGHSITVRNGGTIRIKKGGMLKLMEGSQLIILDGGTVILEEDAKLTTYEGSTLFLHLGGDIELNGGDTELRFKGKLYLFENAVFSPTHDGVSSGTVVIDNPDGTIIAEANTTFELIGDGDDDVMLIINEHGVLQAGSIMTMMRFASCKILIRNGEHSILSYCPFTSVDTQYDVQSNLVDEDVHPSVRVYDKSLITSSEFHDVTLKASLYEPVVGGYFVNMVNTDFDYSYAHDEDQVFVQGGSISFLNCDFVGFEENGIVLNGQTSFSQIQNCNFPATGYFTNSIALSQSASSELYVNNCFFDLHETCIKKDFGKLRLRCNEFKNSAKASIMAGTNVELEMSTNAGYNTFTAMFQHNVRLNDAQSMHVFNGYNDFHEDLIYPTFLGDMQIDGPYLTMMLAQRNKWNASGSEPSPTKFVLSSSITGDPIGLITTFPQTANCGAEDPFEPVIDYAGSSGSYFPNIPISGQSNTMRLDSAVVFAGASTRQWDANESDLVAINRFHDILTYQYTEQQLADTATRYYIDYAYHWMKNTVNHAITDSTILPNNNQNAFSTPVQKYVDVLNAMSSGDTIEGSDYVRRFYIELDKAHLFRSLGYTDIGLDILKNVNLCPLDSNEQVAMNYWLFTYEEEIAWKLLGDSTYGYDTVLTDVSGYAQPVANQIAESYFGSEINSISSISYRSCSGSKKPEFFDNEGSSYPFKLYPNPSNGEITIEYDVPVESFNQLVIYAIDGKEIARINLQGGHRYESIDITHVQSGMYIYELTIDGRSVEMGRVSIAR